jgi:hypothetical protein
MMDEIRCRGEGRFRRFTPYDFPTIFRCDSRLPPQRIFACAASATLALLCGWCCYLAPRLHVTGRPCLTSDTAKEEKRHIPVTYTRVTGAMTRFVLGQLPNPWSLDAIASCPFSFVRPTLSPLTTLSQCNIPFFLSPFLSPASLLS